jgi:natural product precursor
MKKLKKLIINNERLLSTNELNNIKGGNYYYCYWWDGFCYYPIGSVSGSDCATVIKEQESYWGAPVGCTGSDCSSYA